MIRRKSTLYDKLKAKQNFNQKTKKVVSKPMNRYKERKDRSNMPDGRIGIPTPVKNPYGSRPINDPDYRILIPEYKKRKPKPNKPRGDVFINPPALSNFFKKWRF